VAVKYEVQTAKIKILEVARLDNAGLLLAFVPQAFEHFLTKEVAEKI
jgi:hypothetical protein